MLKRASMVLNVSESAGYACCYLQQDYIAISLKDWDLSASLYSPAGFLSMKRGENENGRCKMSCRP
jgi:hypothetical protein